MREFVSPKEKFFELPSYFAIFKNEANKFSFTNRKTCFCFSKIHVITMYSSLLIFKEEKILN